LTITAEYAGALASIPAAIERLRAAGVLDLVSTSRPAAPAPTVALAEKFCPVHADPMKPMSRPDRAGNTHWCTKKVSDGFCKERA